MINTFPNEETKYVYGVVHKEPNMFKEIASPEDLERRVRALTPCVFNFGDWDPEDGGLEWVCFQELFEQLNAEGFVGDKTGAALIRDQLAHPEDYPALFEQEFKEWLDEESEVRILSIRYDAVEVLKSVDFERYLMLMKGFILDVLPNRPSSVMEELREKLEELEGE